jgi:hypothetical protein
MRVTTAYVWTSIGHSPCVAQLVQGRPVEPCRGDPDMDRLVPQERCRTNADLPLGATAFGAGRPAGGVRSVRAIWRGWAVSISRVVVEPQ